MAQSHLFRRSLLCGAVGLAVGLPALISTLPISAAPRKSAATSDAAEDGEESKDVKGGKKEVPNISLFYLRTPWEKVLKDVAAATNTELVAERLPKRSFQRLDRKTHTRGETLRILNQELEKEGFRVKIMGKHLVLMELRSNRREYSRETVPPRNSEADYASRLPHLDDATDEPDSRYPKAPPAERGVAGRQVMQAAGQGRSARRNIRQVNDEVDAGEQAPPVPQKSRIFHYSLKARKVEDVARLMFPAFEDYAEHVDDGPNGLKGIRVYNEKSDSEVEERTVRFSVGIDLVRNQFVIDAPPAVRPAVVRLLKYLDVAPKAADSAVKVVPGIKEPGRVAATLRPELRQLQLAAAEAPDEEGDEEGKAPAGRTRQPARGRAGEVPADAGAQAGVGAEAAGGAAIPALKGEVVVESVPELGIIIIRGNEKDAEAVQALVREIERLSAGSVPQVHIVPLLNVASESLAALLTTVYERLANARGVRTQPGQQQQQGQTVTVLPILRPNALVIIAPASDMDSIRDLAQKFDVPGEPEGEFRVFALKHAVASRVTDSVTKLYPAAQAQAGQGQPGLASLAPKVLIVADMRTNSVIVRAEPRDMREVAALIRKMDVDDAAAVSQMKIYPLKNAVAEELANTLQTSIQSVLNPPRATTTGGGIGGGFQGAGGAGGGATSQELREIKSTIIEFLDPDGTGRVRSGVVADVRFTSDARTNTLVVTAPPACIELIDRLVDRLDRSAQAVAEIKVFSLTNGDATAMVTLLERLFNQAAQQRGAGGGGGFGQAGGIATGPTIAGAEDAGSTLIPLRFSVDVRTNSVIAIGGTEALRVVEAVLLRLDESDIQQRQNKVYKLKNSFAPAVATAISQFLQTQRQAEQVEPGLISPFEQIEREVVVVAEEASNSLLISATPRYFEEIVKLITKLDEAPKQVVIQALLVEVTLDNTDEFGIELGAQDSILFDRSTIAPEAITTISQTFTPASGVTTTSQNVISQSAVPGFLFNTPSPQPFGNNTSPNINSSQVGKQALSSFNLGRVNGDLGYGGLVLSAGSESVSVLLRALASRRRIDVLSRPQIRTLDNQFSQIHVGQEIPRVSGFNTTANTGVNSPTIQQRNVGIILSVTPRISPDGIVVMEIQANKDALNPVGLPLVRNADGSTINSPIIDTTNALAVVAVRSDQTIVLGGMITKSDDVTERKVPLVGDIPLIGELFRYDLKKMRRTELLIFLTPRIVASDADADLIKEVETQRIHFIQEEAEAIHGPIFGLQGQVDCYPGMQSGTPGEVLLPPLVNPTDAPHLAPSPGTPSVAPPTMVPPRTPAIPVRPTPPPPPAAGAQFRRNAPSPGLNFDESEVPTTQMRGGTSLPLQPPPINEEQVWRGRVKTPGRAQVDRSVIQAGYSEPDTPVGSFRVSKSRSSAKASVRSVRKVDVEESSEELPRLSTSEE